MDLNVNLSFNQILRLIHQLPKKEIKRLSDTLQAEMNKPETSVNAIQQLILKAPTWSDEDLNDSNQARVHINNSRIA